MRKILRKLRCAIFGHLILTSYVGKISDKTRFPVEVCLRCGAEWRVIEANMV